MLLRPGVSAPDHIRQQRAISGNHPNIRAHMLATKAGRVAPFQGRGLLLVTDLDGTLIGEDDQATARFKSVWEDVVLPRGGLMVFNTGRPIHSVLELLAEKSPCLVQPHAIISAVGTKIHWKDGCQWREDEEWGRLIGHCWSLRAVHAGVDAALTKVNQGQLYWRPPEDQSEHKVTIGLHACVGDVVLSCVEEALSAEQATANIITSWHGDHRVLDLVPSRAGKLGALEYVRQALGVPISSTVAAGDSGNDILMLSGEHPAIVVGNARPDLLDWLEGDGREQLNGGRLYRAQGHEALGLLEGLGHLGFL